MVPTAGLVGRRVFFLVTVDTSRPDSISVEPRRTVGRQSGHEDGGFRDGFTKIRQREGHRSRRGPMTRDFVKESGTIN